MPHCWIVAGRRRRSPATIGEGPGAEFSGTPTGSAPGHQARDLVCLLAESEPATGDTDSTALVPIPLIAGLTY